MTVFPLVDKHFHLLSNPKALSVQDIIAILGMDELSEEDKLTVARARKAHGFPKDDRLHCTPKLLIDAFFCLRTQWEILEPCSIIENIQPHAPPLLFEYWVCMLHFGIYLMVFKTVASLCRNKTEHGRQLMHRCSVSCRSPSLWGGLEQVMTQWPSLPFPFSSHRLFVVCLLVC